VSDFVPDDLFVLDEIDLAGELDPVPMDTADSIDPVPYVETEFWFAELSTPAVPDVATDLPLPDPFRSRAGLGAGGLLAAAQLADTSASIVSRLNGLRKRRKSEGEPK
jgi:hypothetical protein